jgi:hypothetical protein
MAQDAEISVIIPRREYPRATQRLLHDHTSRAITRALEGDAHVDVVAVPYRLRRAHRNHRGSRPEHYETAAQAT